jgi:hypothetical protein
MAITLVTNDVDRVGFVCNGNSADLSGCETLVAAVAGKSIYLERIAVSFGAAISVTIGAGETTGAVTTVLVGPLYGAANTTVELTFTRPIKVTAATALVADSSGAGNITVLVQGFIK